MKALLVVILVLVSLSFLSMQTPTKVQKSQPSPSSSGCSGSVSESVEDDLQRQEILALRARVAVAEEYKDQLLSTVHWTLGTISGVAILLAGYSWFCESESV